MKSTGWGSSEPALCSQPVQIPWAGEAGRRVPCWINPLVLLIPHGADQHLWGGRNEVQNERPCLEPIAFPSVCWHLPCAGWVQGPTLAGQCRVWGESLELST